MINARDIAKKTMTPEKRKGAKYDLFAFYVGRPISYVLSVPFINMHIRPNVISLLSFIPSLIGFVLLGFGKTPGSRLAGALFFLLWNFMDGIDGNTARYYNQPSKMGRLWDATAGYVATMLLYFAMGLSVVNTSIPSMSLFNKQFIIPDIYFVAMGGLTSINTMFYRLVMHKKSLLYLEDTNKGLISDKNTYSWPMILALNITSTAGFMQLFMIVAVISGYVREFVLAYFMIQLLITIKSLFSTLSLDSDEYLE